MRHENAASVLGGLIGQIAIARVALIVDQLRSPAIQHIGHAGFERQLALHPDVLRVNHVRIEAVDLGVEPAPHLIAILSELPIGERGKRRLLTIALRRSKARQLEGQIGLGIASPRHDAIDLQ